MRRLSVIDSFFYRYDDIFGNMMKQVMKVFHLDILHSQIMLFWFSLYRDL